MDINDLRSAVTVFGLLLFLALVAWVYNARRREAFDAATTAVLRRCARPRGGPAMSDFFSSGWSIYVAAATIIGLAACILLLFIAARRRAPAAGVDDNTTAIASYLIRQGDAVVLIESGPGSTLSALEAGLAKEGLSPRDVTHILLTHIHLDHAGAARWLARQGAEIWVHPIGAPHMVNPEKLIASATRIYGDRMESRWGEFLPVPTNHLKVAQDREAIRIGSTDFIPLHTPGHAEHHFSYQFEDIVFCGDVGGVRIPGYQYMRVPMPVQPRPGSAASITVVFV